MADGFTKKYNVAKLGYYEAYSEAGKVAYKRREVAVT